MFYGSVAIDGWCISDRFSSLLIVTTHLLGRCAFDPDAHGARVGGIPPALVVDPPPASGLAHGAVVIGIWLPGADAGLAHGAAVAAPAHGAFFPSCTFGLAVGAPAMLPSTDIEVEVG